jgi:hypothetical protein
LSRPGWARDGAAAAPAKYTFVMKQGSKVLMRVSITFKTTNTC